MARWWHGCSRRRHAGPSRSSLSARSASTLGLRASRGKKLSKTAVWNLLTNPYYYGVIRYNDRLYTENIQHDPLVSKELFDRVQEAIGRRRKGKYRRHLFAFGGCVMVCGDCGSPITAERQKGHVYYHCTGTRRGCTQRSWSREEVVAEQFTSLLTRLRLPQPFLDYSFAKLKDCHAAQSELTAARRQRLQSELNACHARLDGLLQLKISPGNADGSLLSDEEYRRQKERILNELDTAQRQLTSDQRQGKTWIEDCERVLHPYPETGGALRERVGGREESVTLSRVLETDAPESRGGARSSGSRSPHSPRSRWPECPTDPNPNRPDRRPERRTRQSWSLGWACWTSSELFGFNQRKNHCLSAVRLSTSAPLSNRKSGTYERERSGDV